MILQVIDIKVHYNNTLEQVTKVCRDAFEDMIESFAVESVERKYFPEDVFVRIEIDSF